mmetsp:Transcript_14376/g.16066  ORF Transcript_14376/g.16066 Transcript_14376/m.16066 type:complete len:152 (-) Transcript_14376:397-852(-)
MLRSIQFKATKGYIWSKKKSPFFDPRTHKFRIRSVLAIIMDGVFKVSGGYLTIQTFKSSLEANINQGAITTIFSLSSILVAIGSFFIFKEKMTKYHLVGMIFLVGCALLIIMAPNEDDESSGGEEGDNPISPLWPVLFAFLTTLTFAIRAI